MKDRIETDVLICGAGAAGLALAADLARRGVPFLLIDAAETPFAGSRGKGIQPRTLEIFEALGLVDRLAAAGSPYPRQRIHAADGSFEDEPDRAEASTPSEPYRAPLLIPQFRTEALLREHLAEFGHPVTFGTRLTGFVDEGHQVVARTSGADGEQTVACRYLIGADGGRSFVRHALEIGFPGETLGVRAIVADIAMDGLSRDRWHRFNTDDLRRHALICPLPHTGLMQLQAPIPMDGEPDLSAAGLQHLIDSRIPQGGIKVHAVAWASAYAMNARLADRYRVGRVFLVGDAAHIHPPTGGQGLNTSVQDAYNIGWKIAAVLDGAPPSLLDTYEEERRPIAAGVLGLAARLLENLKRGNLRRERETRQLDLGYRGSSLAMDGVENAALCAGDRMPDCRLAGAAGHPRRLLDLLAGPHWTVLERPGRNAPAVAPRRGVQTLAIGPGGAAHDEDGSLALGEGEVLAVRPDGYVGARFLRDDPRLADYLDGVLPAAASGVRSAGRR